MVLNKSHDLMIQDLFFILARYCNSWIHASLKLEFQSKSLTRIFIFCHFINENVITGVYFSNIIFLHLALILFIKIIWNKLNPSIPESTITFVKNINYIIKIKLCRSTWSYHKIDGIQKKDIKVRIPTELPMAVFKPEHVIYIKAMVLCVTRIVLVLCISYSLSKCKWLIQLYKMFFIWISRYRSNYIYIF
jgi:hypothetical protein